MNPIDAISEGTRGDQKRHGTFHTNFARLAEEYERLMKAGGNSETLRDAFVELLRTFEQERVDCEQRIHRAEREIDYCRAMQRACSQHSNLLVATLCRRAGEWERSGQPPIPPSSPSKELADGSKRFTEEESKNIHCAACGCVDADDAAKCDCSCHKGKPCGNPQCVPCLALVEAETSGRRKPTKKRAPRKKATKK